MHRRAVTLVVAFLVAACASPPADSPAPTASTSAAPGTPAASREPLTLAGTPLEPCQIGSFGNTSALCGYLTVPEDPATPGGRDLDLRVAVIPARSATPEPDPVFMLAGGPGGAATASLDWTADVFGGIHENRDIVLVDQRGVGGSNALLVGQPPDVSGMSETEADTVIRAWVAEQLDSFDADPRYYTTSFAMDDVDAVREALGYDRINMFGASYGATAAQYYIRQHGDRLRAVVLDGATLLDVPVFERIAANSQDALDQLAERCAADADCAAAYPAFSDELDRVMAALADDPVTTGVKVPGTDEPMVVDAGGFAGAIHAGLLGETSSAHIPWFIHSADQGRWDEVANAILAASGGSASNNNPVMSQMIRCAESWARFDPAEVARLGAGSYYLDVQLAAAQEQARSCGYVPRGVVPDSDAEPARTDVPVLLVVGSADPQDPPANIESAPDYFPNGVTVVAEGHGHTVAHLGCMPSIVDAFIEGGTATSLDTSCVAEGVPLSPFRLQ
jgi:pimeloyl-ACP methyl ester carboxylesterase